MSCAASNYLPGNVHSVLIIPSTARDLTYHHRTTSHLNLPTLDSAFALNHFSFRAAIFDLLLAGDRIANSSIALVENEPIEQSILTQHHWHFRDRHGATAFQFRLGHHLIGLRHPDDFFDRRLSLGHATPAIGA
jgi:hypothetical protein